jgi:hypothetical protein
MVTGIAVFTPGSRFLLLSLKHVYFQYCQCFVSGSEEAIFALHLKWIWSSEVETHKLLQDPG